MTSALNLIAGLILAGCTAGGTPVTSGKSVKPAPIVEADEEPEEEPADLPEDDGPDEEDIADEDIPVPDDFESEADDISEDNLEAELKELEAEIGD